jgi:PIN domain nuclease of toxin-antitoxin system
MRLVLDAGALIAIDRNDPRVAGLIALGRRAGADLVTVAPVVGQAWRDGARQARLARALPMIDVLDVDRACAQAAGEVLRESGCSDVVDALVALATRPGDQVLTSDPGDLGALLAARNVNATVVRL